MNKVSGWEPGSYGLCDEESSVLAGNRATTPLLFSQ